MMDSNWWWQIFSSLSVKMKDNQKVLGKLWCVRGGGGALLIMRTDIKKFYLSDDRARKKCIVQTRYLFIPSEVV